jgi:DNA-binding LacI/PurR family transcriptional regulator
LSNPSLTVATRSLHPARLAALNALRLMTVEMAGRKLPGERELAKQLSLSRQHLRVLLDILEVEGAVERRQGSGTYAVDLRKTEVTHICLLIDSRLKLGNDPFFSLLTEKLQFCLQAVGIHCVVERTDGEQRPRFLGEGIITLGLAGLAAVSRLRADDPPAVSLLAEEQNEPLHFTGRVSLLLADDKGAGIEAGRRALQEGCRHLIFFGRSHLPASRARWEGVQQAVAAQDDPDITVEIVECAMNYESGHTVAPQFAECFRDKSVAHIGLIAGNDWLAVGLRAGFAECGSPLRGNRMFSFDGLPVAENPALEIVSLRFPFATVGEDALEELRRLTRHRTGRVIRYAMEWGDGWSE